MHSEKKNGDNHHGFTRTPHTDHVKVSDLYCGKIFTIRRLVTFLVDHLLIYILFVQATANFYFPARPWAPSKMAPDLQDLSILHVGFSVPTKGEEESKSKRYLEEDCMSVDFEIELMSVQK